MRRLKEVKDLDMEIVKSQVQSVCDSKVRDLSHDVKLEILQSTINIVEKYKQTFGKTKQMSSLEKNRIALNLLQTMKQGDKAYQEKKHNALQRNVSYQESKLLLKYSTQPYLKQKNGRKGGSNPSNSLS